LTIESIVELLTIQHMIITAKCLVNIKITLQRYQSLLKIDFTLYINSIKLILTKKRIMKVYLVKFQLDLLVIRKKSQY